MTDGHKHRRVRVKKDGLLYRVLRAHLIHVGDIDRVDRSPYPYGSAYCRHGGYYLSALAILHRWTGLTLEVRNGEAEG